MFWDCSYSASPHIEELLSKPDVTLKELLEEEEIMQEYKSQNKSLVQFFHRYDILEELISLITTEPPADLPDATRFKQANVACEILTTDTPALTERLIGNQLLLEKLYSFLEQDSPLNPLLTSFFSKTFGTLIVKKTEQNWFSYQCVCIQMLEFIKTRPRFLDTLFKHIATPAIMDLLFQIIINVEGPNPQHDLFDWLQEQHLVQRLINILGCDAESEKHQNVSQFLCDLISHSRTCRQSDLIKHGKPNEQFNLSLLHQIEDSEVTKNLLEIILLNSTREMTVVSGIKIILKLLEKPVINERDPKLLEIITEAEDKNRKNLLDKIMPLVALRIKEFQSLLVNPPPKPDIKNTATFLSPPFGNTRLQICVFISALLQSENPQIALTICETDVFNTLLKLFKQYCWNNLLHNQVRSCLIYALTPRVDTPAKISCPADASESTISALLKHIINNCKVVSKLIDCWTENKENMKESTKKGRRLGYMGHLIQILDVVTMYCTLNEEYCALVESSMTETELLQWNLITNKETGELSNELKIQNLFLANINPYEKNDDTFNDGLGDGNARFDEVSGWQYVLNSSNSEQYSEDTEQVLSQMMDNIQSNYILNDDGDDDIDDDFDEIGSGHHQQSINFNKQINRLNSQNHTLDWDCDFVESKDGNANLSAPHQQHQVTASTASTAPTTFTATVMTATSVTAAGAPTLPPTTVADENSTSSPPSINAVTTTIAETITDTINNKKTAAFFNFDEAFGNCSSNAFEMIGGSGRESIDAIGDQFFPTDDDFQANFQDANIPPPNTEQLLPFAPSTATAVGAVGSGYGPIFYSDSESD